MADRKRQTTIRTVRELLFTQPLARLYSSPCVGRAGQTSDTQEPFAEVIAEELLRIQVAQLLGSVGIPPQRAMPYRQGHDGTVSTPTTPRSATSERRLAIALYNYSRDHGGDCFGLLGQPIDYEVPLQAQRGAGIGEIDLLTQVKEESPGIENARGVYVVELKRKREKSPESLLRSVLQIATYYQQLDREKLLRDYGLYGDPSGYGTHEIRKAVLVFRGSAQEREIQAIKKGSLPNLRRLIEDLGVHLFVIDADDTVVDQGTGPYRPVLQGGGAGVRSVKRVLL
ncbi:MAG TPA: hypothetical protein PLY56_10075 [Armatimonadota bacterium]|jgi:hypothetical protein|nr:hypothetical protein [Armatimonadota bacterium]HPO73366.1 hypothetical protein [Armatimonadota bacterium]